ncbi:MAG: threonine--tRNA ligase [Candidatus Caldarchaeum sp.]|nr:threonine--tRNA ligase [Candidatus Caldarchaeum sp.]
MRVLEFHVDFIEYRPVRREVEVAEDSSTEAKRVEDALVMFTSVEPEDDERVAEAAVADALEFMKRLKVPRLVIYPFAHLTKELAKPEHALEVLKAMEKAALKSGVEVHRSPFGWNKALSVSVKGHPLAERSRVFTHAAIQPTKQPTAEKTYLILTPEDTLLSPEKIYELKAPEEFRTLVEREALGKTSPEAEAPPHHRVLRKFGIDWEEMSDSGHMRYGPEGALVYELISDYASQVVRELGFPVYFVKGTNMFSLESRPIKEHANLFGQRMYRVEVDGSPYVMRYAACFQQFALARKWVISYRNLPFGMFEVADSYRLEQRGELLLGFRLRKMSMPDLHVFCKDLSQAQQMVEKIHDRIYTEMEKLGRDYYSLYNLTSRSFFESNRPFFQRLLRRERKPALLSFYPENSSYYWVLNIEYHIVDSLGRPREIGTVQIDVGNAERFGITYVDHDGVKKHPVIIHSAVIGTVERYLYSVVDTALRKTPPTLPTWLSPTQVRILPLNEKYVGKALKLAEKLSREGVRVDVDDRPESLGKKVYEAETSWIPYVATLGPKEARTGRLSVRVREEKKIRQMAVQTLVKRVRKETEGYPFRPLPIPPEVSKRPEYGG